MELQQQNDHKVRLTEVTLFAADLSATTPTVLADGGALDSTDIGASPKTFYVQTSNSFGVSDAMIEVVSAVPGAPSSFSAGIIGENEWLFVVKPPATDGGSPVTKYVLEVWVPFGSPCLLYTSPSPRDQRGSRMPSSA